LTAQAFTVADILMTHVLHVGPSDRLVKPYPEVLAYLGRCTERAAWKKTVAAYAARGEAA